MTITVENTSLEAVVRRPEVSKPSATIPVNSYGVRKPICVTPLCQGGIEGDRVRITHSKLRGYAGYQVKSCAMDQLAPTVRRTLRTERQEAIEEKWVVDKVCLADRKDYPGNPL